MYICGTRVLVNILVHSTGLNLFKCGIRDVNLSGRLLREGMFIIIWFQFNFTLSTVTVLLRFKYSISSSDLVGTFGGASVCISAYGDW